MRKERAHVKLSVSNAVCDTKNNTKNVSTPKIIGYFSRVLTNAGLFSVRKQIPTTHH